jgi:hypothetical protein
MKDIKQIACIPTSPGFYVSCGNDPNLLIPIDPKNQGLDIPTEVVIEKTVSDPYAATGGLSFSFGDLFKGNVNSMITVVIYVVIGIAILVVIILVVCCVLKYCKRQGNMGVPLVAY